MCSTPHAKRTYWGTQDIGEKTTQKPMMYITSAEPLGIEVLNSSGLQVVETSTKSEPLTVGKMIEDSTIKNEGGLIDLQGR